MRKYRISILINVVLSVLLVMLFIYYNQRDAHTKLNIYQYKVDEVIPQDEEGMQLYIIAKEYVEEAIPVLSIYRKVFYFQANKNVIEPLLLNEKYQLDWYELKTKDLIDYKIEGYFAYLKDETIQLIPHYVKEGYNVNLLEEFDNDDMMPYTIAYLDDHMNYYRKKNIKKNKQVGFISDDKLFSYVEMKYHSIGEIANNFVRINSCYVRTTSKTNTLNSFDLSAKSTYQHDVKRYLNMDKITNEIDVQDYWGFLTKVNLGGKVKITEYDESETEYHYHAYKFASKAHTYAGIIQFKETDDKDKKYQLDTCVKWNFKGESFELTFNLDK